ANEPSLHGSDMRVWISWRCGLLLLAVGSLLWRWPQGELPPAERLGVAEAATPVPAPAATPAPAPVTVKPAPTELPATGDAAVLRRHAGLYVDKARSLEFKDIVLLTVANAAYMDFLRNWECHAHRLGLDWVVLALDDE
ncbi:unnamed protein product, partial [Effrenium voratum]